VVLGAKRVPDAFLEPLAGKGFEIACV